MNRAMDEPLSAALGEDAVEVVRRGTFDRWYPAGAVIAPKGEVPEHWIGVVSGMIKVDTNLADGKSTLSRQAASKGLHQLMEQGLIDDEISRELPAAEWKALASARATLPSWMARAIGEEAVRG